MIRRFTMYRRDMANTPHTPEQKNPEDEPQFEGVVFSDGKIAIRWLTSCRSVSVWDSMEDMMMIHGHPEYGSELVWHDGAPNEPVTGEIDNLYKIASCMLTALNTGDVQTNSPLHLKLRELVIAYRKHMNL